MDSKWREGDERLKCQVTPWFGGFDHFIYITFEDF